MPQTPSDVIRNLDFYQDMLGACGLIRIDFLINSM